MIRLEKKNYNTILMKKHQKSQHGHQVKLITLDIFQAKKHYLQVQVKNLNNLDLH